MLPTKTQSSGAVIIVVPPVACMDESTPSRRIGYPGRKKAVVGLLIHAIFSVFPAGCGGFCFLVSSGVWGLEGVVRYDRILREDMLYYH